MTTKVLIIGAGPSGASCAIRLMQAGIDCLLIDRQQFPRPKLCAGLFTHKSQDALRYLVQEENYNNCMNQTVTSHESKFRLFKDPHHLMVECTPDEPVTLVDRQEFDQWLVNHYIGLGGQFRDNTQLQSVDFVNQEATFDTVTVHYDYLIAADGANSTIERLLSKTCPDTFKRKRESTLCLEINVDRSDLDMDGVNIYFNVVPKSYAWVFAKGDKTCIGMCKLPEQDFDINQTMRHFIADLGVKNAEKYPLRGAMLPIGNYMERPVHWNTLFVGDAAGLVEPLTGEGIFYAIQSGIDAAEAIEANGTTSAIYINKVKRLTALIDKGQKYQSMLESPKLSSLFFRHCHKHPGFIRHFYDTQIEHACLDPFWKIVAKYKMPFLTLLLAIVSLTSMAQVPIDTTEVVPISWQAAQKLTKYEWYVTKQARTLADTIVYYQLPSGGWCKNQDWWLNPDTNYLNQCKQTGIGSTIDNGATTAELLFLAKMYYYNNIIAYRVAFLKGVEYLLDMQYENGGWPQFYPFRGDNHYSNHITFNDNAMLSVMHFLHDVANNVEPYDMLFLHKDLRDRCMAAYNKGVECILRCQIRTDEEGLTVWCQQHDENTLQPAGARSYEPPSYCGTFETCQLINELLNQPQQTEEIMMAVDGAIRWLDSHKITGKRIQHYTNAEGKPDFRLVNDPTAPALWARMYDLISGQPIFCGRDGITHSNIEEIDYERRTGYSWLGTDPQKLIDEFPEWEARMLNGYMME